MSKRVSIILPGEMEPPPPPQVSPKSKSRPKLLVKSSLRKPSSSPLGLRTTSSYQPPGTRLNPRTSYTNQRSLVIPGTTSSNSTRSAMQMTSSGWSSSSRNYFREPTNTFTQRWIPALRMGAQQQANSQDISQSDVTQRTSISTKSSVRSFLERAVSVVGAGSTTSIIKFFNFFRGESSSSANSQPENSPAHSSLNPAESLTLFRREEPFTDDASSVQLRRKSSSAESHSFCPSSQPSVVSLKKPSTMEVLPKSSRRSLASVGRRSTSRSRLSVPEFSFALVSADGTIKPAGESKPTPSKSQTADPSSASEGNSEPPSSCATYDERCGCCHCVHMRHAVEQVEFMASDEGQRRQLMQLAAKNVFLDICAMSVVRERILNDLHGTGPQRPSPRISYPLAITSARRMDKRSLAIEWFVHDYRDIAHYEIYVDNALSRSIYNPRTLHTVLLDIDTSTSHKLRMRPIPVQGRVPGAKPEDRMVQQLREVGMDSVTAGTLCQCLKRQQDARQCKSMLDFWTDSEFLYLPGECTRS
ncbi:uncharacterized serine-rich protein C215.13 [Drosophila madeirensis]|uniref:Uncharacterized serine-rich protein C215.13 n=1 Tax=Drosophila madeirensis TaxID=30013 RepID=A0AAU9GD22_DROMD